MVNLRLFIVLIVTAVISSSAFFFFPEAEATGAEPALAIAFASSITQLVALWYFLSSLTIIKRSLKIAYYLFALGIFLFSLIQLLPSLTVIPMFGQLYANELLANILFLTPYGFGALFMYVGMWKFARLLALPHTGSSFLLAIFGAAALALLFVVLPHPEDTIEPTARAVMAICGAFSVAAVLMALRIRRTIGAIYKASISWTAVALGAIAFTTFHELIVKTYLIGSDYAFHSLSLWPFLLTGILLLKAGASFKETGRGILRLPQNASYIDVVLNAAQLVSNPGAIDKELDKVRFITSQGKTNLSTSEKQTLLQVYLYIETYLTTKEPLYAYTKENLRANVPPGFLQGQN